MNNSSEYRHTTADLAIEFAISKKTVRKKAQALGLGIEVGGRAGYRYSDVDRLRLIDSMRPEAPVAPRRKRRATAA